MGIVIIRFDGTIFVNFINLINYYLGMYYNNNVFVLFWLVSLHGD